MRLKKLLGKNIGSIEMPICVNGNIPNSKKKIYIELDIANNILPSLYPDKVKKENGCYLVFKSVKECHPNKIVMHAIKISRKEAYKFMKSEVIFNKWRK